ncbi:MAG: DUF1648 domain-containing protein, partial [Lacisediminihabitans sp.]
MTWFAILFSTIIIALLAGLLYAMPSITSSTLPLGVSVPQARAGDPIIMSSVRRYRLWVVLSLVASLAITFILGAIAPAAGLIAPVLMFIALGLLSYMVARTAIMRAKQAGGWYDGVPVRLTANIASSKTVTPLPFGWYLAAVVVLVITAGIGVAVYPGLPNPLPTHWGANGEPDTYSAKSVWSAFGVVLIGFGMIAFMFGISFLVRVSPQRRLPSDSAALAAQRTATVQRLTGSALGQITLISSLLFGVLTVFTWTEPSAAWLPFTSTMVFLVLIAGAIATYFVRYRRSMAQPEPANAEVSRARAHAAGRSAASVDAPDDDRFWKAG